MTEKIKGKCRSGCNIEETGCAIQGQRTKGQAYHRAICDDPCPTETVTMPRYRVRLLPTGWSCCDVP
ncbi:Hypothetical predicted protein [Paramuricea clavata]|uniref:Uncharacterized protein n=1 Tax=Paramuricea clavata TaxID=317549 RepID=A0A7D9DFK6_PARCT|nr:Hypothetical predicted protein [Paramuricea clavata]